MKKRFPRGPTGMPPLLDAHRLDEGARCRAIAELALEGQIVGFIVEDDAKADRYVRKILAIAPAAVELQRVPGPVPGTILVKVGLPQAEN